MNYRKKHEGNIFIVNLSGRFTVLDNNKFRDIIKYISQKDLDKNIESISFDFSDVEYIDSAALGILLLLKENADKKSIKVSLTGASGQVKKMFHISRFHDIFEEIS
ncbi:STAS domain-containing protein [Rickettsiales bacterium]|nr:STAS domain-containing protein [Rickettsiales bacterium]